ncbi:ABC_transporter substrate-binding protein [Hexamita inflata]|uniref:ABC transporter substrate-binding protein n=1 Tax=Hexamita inflata TaxID=28002 RepID=A0AA86NQB1_9EUKA|nr:ABC transporter substrate-binding protein [Hexamita inflata]
MKQSYSYDFIQYSRLLNICQQELKNIKKCYNIIKQPIDLYLDTYLYLELKSKKIIEEQQELYGFIQQQAIDQRKVELEQKYQVFNMNSIISSINEQLQNPDIEKEMANDHYLIKQSDNWMEEFESGIDINIDDHTLIANTDITSFKVADYFTNPNLRIESCTGIKFKRVPTRITKLELFECHFDSLEGIGQMKQLLELALQAQPNKPSKTKDKQVVKQLEPKYLRNLNNLTSLQVNKYDITDISVLKFLTKLKSLDLSENLISDIYPISYLHNLQSLSLNTNQIIDISYLKTLNIIKLDIQNNKIADLSPVKPKARDKTQKKAFKKDILNSKRLNSFYNSWSLLRNMDMKQKQMNIRKQTLVENLKYLVQQTTYEQIDVTRRVIISQFFRE